MKKLLSALVLTAFLISVFVTGFPQVSEAAALYAEDFETIEALENWTSEDGVLEITDERRKFNQSSLKWSYTSGGTLRGKCEEFGNFNDYSVNQGIELWIYNTQKTDADMRIKIGKAASIDKTPTYDFAVNMNFEGWRCIWAQLNQIAKTGHNGQGDDTIQLELPRKMGSGELYIDGFEIPTNVYYATAADFQVRNIPVAERTAQYISYLNIPERTQEKYCLPEHKKAFKIIEERFDDYILPEGIDYKSLAMDNPQKIRYDSYKRAIESNIKKYNAYNIVRRPDGTMDGPGLTCTVDDNGVTMDNFEKIWVALMLDWKINKNVESKNKLMDLFDYSYEQGWAEGSALGNIHFSDLHTSGYAYAVYFMRDELKETDRLERELATLRWRSSFGFIFSYDIPGIEEYFAIDADRIRTVLQFQLMYILTMEDSPEKVGYMKAYVKYLEDIIEPRQAMEGVVKQDYTLWHHDIAYMSAYGSEAINVLAQLKYFLNGTCFDLSTETTQTLWNVLQTYRVSADRYSLPLRVRGRFPESDTSMVSVAPAYAFMAMCENNEAAEIFLDLWDEESAAIQEAYKSNLPNITWMTTLGQLDLFKNVKTMAKKNGYTAAKPMQGSYIFPYGGYAVFRKGNYMVSIGGFSKYLWDYEGSTSQNFYGRYMNYGSAVISTQNGFIQNGIDLTKGWDWNRWPGVTSKILPPDELEIKGNARYYSDEAFLGGVTSDDGNGLYAMKLHDTQYDITFRAKKSYFFFDGKMICLGSDISNSDKEHMTQTTLFQNTYGNKIFPSINLDNQEVGFPFTQTTDTLKTLCFTDAVGNGYIVPETQNLTIELKENESVLQNGVKSLGNIAVAYINHGKAPQNADYEYVVLPQCNAEELLREYKTPSYQVLKKDDKAHIVKHNEKNQIGYVCFSKNYGLNYGAVRTVTRPCTIMESYDKDKNLCLSFADPDLRINVVSVNMEQKRKQSEIKTTRVELNGRWKLKNPSEHVRVAAYGNNTVLEFDGYSGVQTNAILIAN